jgi:hypothetical protein
MKVYTIYFIGVLAVRLDLVSGRRLAEPDVNKANVVAERELKLAMTAAQNKNQIRSLVGNVNPAAAFPLGLCNCNVDSDCATTQNCYRWNGFDTAPACGGGNLMGYCIPNVSRNPVTVSNCGCSDCTASQLDQSLGDGTTCRERMNWLVQNQGQTETQACRKVVRDTAAENVRIRRLTFCSWKLLVMVLTHCFFDGAVYNSRRNSLLIVD